MKILFIIVLITLINSIYCTDIKGSFLVLYNIQPNAYMFNMDGTHMFICKAYNKCGW